MSSLESWEISFLSVAGNFLLLIRTNKKRQKSCENRSVLGAGGSSKCGDPTFPSSHLRALCPSLVSSAWAWQGPYCNPERRQGKSGVLIGLCLTTDTFAQGLEHKDQTVRIMPWQWNRIPADYHCLCTRSPARRTYPAVSQICHAIPKGNSQSNPVRVSVFRHIQFYLTVVPGK